MFALTINNSTNALSRVENICNFLQRRAAFDGRCGLRIERNANNGRRANAFCSTRPGWHVPVYRDVRQPHPTDRGRELSQSINKTRLVFVTSNVIVTRDANTRHVKPGESPTIVRDNSYYRNNNTGGNGRYRPPTGDNVVKQMYTRDKHGTYVLWQMSVAITFYGTGDDKSIYRRSVVRRRAGTTSFTWRSYAFTRLLRVVRLWHFELLTCWAEQILIIV